MNISVLITSKNHPVVSYIKKWSKENDRLHNIKIVHSQKELTGGDILFLISCNEKVLDEERNKFNKTLLIHASDLPKGRGWSPHIWEIINGATQVTVALLEATDEIDAGDIWKKVKVKIPKTALFDEINDLIFHSEIKLMDFAINNFKTVKPTPQPPSIPSYWSKRTPNDSEIDIDKKISEQFNLIRVCNPKFFPAFFYKDGIRFNIEIKKHDK